jgi:hypothetical protein
MTEPRLFDVMCLDNRCLHRMAYAEWGDAANPKLLLCLHGLTRQGRDFDTLARALAGEYRVVCHDVVGRGRSDWLADPMGYAIPQYVADMVTLLARLDAVSVDLVGTIVVRRVRRDSIRSEARWPWASGCNTAGPVAVMHILALQRCRA